MSDEKYIVDIGEEGSQGLGKLDFLYNPSTQAFLKRAGLKEGMTILDIGCGSGVMTCWLAEKVGNQGRVIAIENDQNQLNAAKTNAEKRSIGNIDFKLCSAYDIDTLNEQFDLVYCRFVLHHLHEPMDVIRKIYQVLKPNGIYAAEEGIVNYAFSYPFSPAWGDEEQRVPPVWVDAPKGERDSNIGVKMYTKMHNAGFKIQSVNIVHPVLTTKKEKELLLLGIGEMKQYYLDQGHTEADWQQLVNQTQDIVNNEGQIAGFYGGFQAVGVKNSL